MTEISIFDGQHRLSITKPLRLIELFAGYGSQSLSLDYLKIPYESYAISEWAIKSIQAYKDMHKPKDKNPYDVVFTDKEIRRFFYGGKISGDYSIPLTDEQINKMNIDNLRRIFRNMAATNNKGSICGIHAKDIRLEGDYTYLCTYSFPCQDLSNAGLRQGMSRGSGTRSGLLWEVERLLNEWNAQGRVPDVLLMENVPEVVGRKNRKAWEEWILALDSLGYKSYWKIINATDFGIPQNRKRCFMVSVQGDYYFEFPETVGCSIKLRDVLEPKESVDESYYLSDELVNSFVKWSDRHQAAGDGFCFRPTEREDAERAWGLSCKAGSRGGDNFINEGDGVELFRSEEWGGNRNFGEMAPTLKAEKVDAGVVECHKVGDLTGGGYEKMFEQSRRVYGNDGASPALHTCGGGNLEVKVLVDDGNVTTDSAMEGSEECP